MYNWSQFMLGYFGVKVKKQGNQPLYKKGPVLYLCNHRSWADFFTDVYLTEGNSALMSRWMVYFVFPIFMTAVIVLRGIVLFKRGTIADKQAFNKWLDGVLASSPVPGLLVYPEGHRSTKATSLPLKRGMLYYAHSRHMLVQVIISTNKEAVMGEKRRSVRFGATVVTAFSEVIPTEGVSFEDFYTRLQAAWDKTWEEAYSADAAQLPPVVHDSVPDFEYTRGMKAQMAAVTTFAIAVLAGVLVLGARALLAATALAGPLGQQVTLGVLAAYVATSLLVSRA